MVVHSIMAAPVALKELLVLSFSLMPHQSVGKSPSGLAQVPLMVNVFPLEDTYVHGSLQLHPAKSQGWVVWEDETIIMIRSLACNQVAR